MFLFLLFTGFVYWAVSWDLQLKILFAGHEFME